LLLFFGTMKCKILLIFILVFVISSKTFSQFSTRTEKVEVDTLKTYQIQKLKQEVEKLKSDNSLNPIVRILPEYAVIFTAFVAVIGAFLSILKFLKEKHNEIEQKNYENKVRLEKYFDSVLNNLGSSSQSIQASAVISLLTFLNPEYKEFHQQVYLILLANLKTKPHKVINSLMVKTFEKALRVNLESIQLQKKNPTYNGNYNIDLDLSHINVARIDLHGLNLENADLAFSNFQHANLTGCILRRVKGFGADFSCAILSRANLEEGRFVEANFENAQFHESKLISTKFNKTNLRGTKFQQAELQDAHLNESIIYGAKFEHANLNNTFLRGIKYNGSDLESILKSKDRSWGKANFDENTNQALNAMNKK